jgi:hypothetical protein
MAKPTERISVPHPHKLFVTCESYRLATARLFEEWSKGENIYVYAYIGLDAFCCELFLKCVDAVRTGSHLRSHKLIELFNVLSKDDQDAIECHFDAQSKGTPNHHPLREILTKCSSLFEDVRYWYEGKLRPAHMNLIYPVTALRSRVLEIRPDWTPRRKVKEPTCFRHGMLPRASWIGSTLPLSTQWPSPQSQGSTIPSGNQSQ